MRSFILVLLPLLSLGQGVIHAPYQVGLFLFDNYNPNFAEKNYPICSAAIVHPLFCVTTADCVHSRIQSHNIIRPLLPNSLYIKSGNFSEVRENIKYVKAIHVHPEFNSTALKNDIALIQLESLFQFDHVYNERWVDLPDDRWVQRYDRCIYSINTANGRNEIYPFGKIKQTTVVNSSVCRANESDSLDNYDVCSLYEFDHPFMCQLPENQLRLSPDRGTPLICDNKLAGLLSIIRPANVANTTESCSQTLQTPAYYTRVQSYEKWIHSVIASNSPEHTPDGKPIPIKPISPPYQNVPGKPSNAASAVNSYYITMITFITCLLAHKFSQN